MTYRIPHILPSDISPKVARVAPLLFLLSRETLSVEDAVLARNMAQTITDWSEVERSAIQKRSLPFVYRHISNLGLLPPDSPVLQRMRMNTLMVASQWLKNASAQRSFLDDCLAPNSTPHLFFKGISLGRYYAEPALRFSRDIDVLVRKESLWPILTLARDRGYRVILDVKKGRFAQSKRDLQALIRYKNDIPLVSPKGDLIELHSDLWHGGEFSSNADVLDRAEPLSVSGTTYSVMPTSLLFVYLCQHHNRHLWSSLNWLADISAITRAPEFDEDEVISAAEQLELREVVEATLAFDDLCRQRPSKRSNVVNEHARECHHLCMLNMDGDEQTARSLYFEEVTPVEDWRIRKNQRLSLRKRKWKSRGTPNLDQYLSFPLPIWLHWTYPIWRAFGGALRIFGPVSKQSS